MSATSNAAIERDEARELSGAALVECERDHHKDRASQLETRLQAVVKVLAASEGDILKDGGSDIPFCRGLAAGYRNAAEMLREALKAD